MNKKQITFKLNNTEKIVITSEESLNDIHCCSRALITFNKGNEILKLEDNSLVHNLHEFISLLTKALNNELNIHKSIQNNLGYLGAHYSFYSLAENKLIQSGLVFDKNDWVGEKYQLWAHLCVWDFTGWVYNDKSGNIILELTPRYKGSWFDPDKPKKVKEYEEFLANYKSYSTTIISIETAKRLLDQAHTILKQIDKNVERFIKEIEQEETEKKIKTSVLTRYQYGKLNMFSYRITKYNPAYRNEQGWYLKDNWTCYSEIGRRRNGEILTLDEYLEVENKYIQAIIQFMECNKITFFQVNDIEKSFNPANDLNSTQEMIATRKKIKNRSFVAEKDFESVCKLILRNYLWCRLKNNKNMEVHFGGDYYMYILSKSTCKKAIETIEKLGLFVEECESPYLPEE